MINDQARLHKIWKNVAIELTTIVKMASKHLNAVHLSVFFFDISNTISLKGKKISFLKL